MEKDLGKIKKNEVTDIVVRIDDFGGKIGLTIREFSNSEILFVGSEQGLESRLVPKYGYRLKTLKIGGVVYL